MNSCSFFNSTLGSHSPYVTTSLTWGWVCRLQLLLGLASAVILGSESHGTHNHVLLSQNRDSHNLESQVLVFVSPRNRVARLYLQALGSFFVASYDSHGYGGGIRHRLHMGVRFSVTLVINLSYLLDLPSCRIQRQLPSVRLPHRLRNTGLNTTGTIHFTKKPYCISALEVLVPVMTI
jgi:hypothetical protein